MPLSGKLDGLPKSLETNLGKHGTTIKLNVVEIEWTWTTKNHKENSEVAEDEKAFPINS